MSIMVILLHAIPPPPPPGSGSRLNLPASSRLYSTYSVTLPDETAKWVFSRHGNKSRAKLGEGGGGGGSYGGRDLIHLVAVEFLVVFDYSVSLLLLLVHHYCTRLTAHLPPTCCTEPLRRPLAHPPLQ